MLITQPAVAVAVGVDTSLLHRRTMTSLVTSHRPRPQHPHQSILTITRAAEVAHGQLQKAM